MKFNDALFGAIFVALGIYLLFQIQGFPAIPGQQYGAGAFPGLIGIGFLVAGTLLVLAGIRHRAAAPWMVPGEWMASRRHVTAFACLLLGAVAYVLFADDLGFLLLAPAVLFVWFLVLGVRPMPALVTALLAVLLIWFAFYKLLRVPLPWGLLKPFAF